MEWTYAEFEKEVKLALQLQGINPRNFRSFGNGLHELDNIGTIRVFDITRESADTIFFQAFLVEEQTEHRVIVIFGDWGNIESVEVI